MRFITLLCAGSAWLSLSVFATPVVAAGCDKACLEKIAESYREAYRSHDPSKAPIAKRVRFTENNVEMAFPDGSWDTVTAGRRYGRCCCPIRRRATSRIFTA